MNAAGRGREGGELHGHWSLAKQRITLQLVFHKLHPAVKDEQFFSPVIERSWAPVYDLSPEYRD